MNACPNCGSNALRFDIPSQQLKCDHCDSLFAVSALPAGTADEQQVLGATVYTCSACGAQLATLDQEMIGFCSYCGATGTLEGRLSQETRPTRIIPFQITRERCVQEYTQLVKRSPYAPREFRDPQYIDRFRGIYVPYWMYAVDFLPQITLQATKNYTSGEYAYREVHQVTTDLQGVYQGIPYDASSFFDDTIAENIAPYHQQRIVPFQNGYLPGFYADTADVNSALYQTDAENRATKNVVREITSLYAAQNLVVEKPSLAEARQRLQTHCVGCESTLFPVWFLTWRKRNRVAYVVMNGETGKFSADLPVDIGRFLLGSALTSVVLFLILSLFVAMTAPTALFFSSVLAVIALGLFVLEIQAIHDKENHVFDRGFFIRGEASALSPEKAEEIRQVRLRKQERKEQLRETFEKGSLGNIFKWVFWTLFLLPFLSLGFTFIGMIIHAVTSSWAGLGCFFAVLFGIFYLTRLLPLLPRVQKNTLFQALPAFLSVLVALVIALFAPTQDLFYYAGCVLCLAGVLITCLSLITKYNLLATRPVPHMHDRGKTPGTGSPEGQMPVDSAPAGDGSGSAFSGRPLLAWVLAALSLLVFSTTSRFAFAYAGTPVYTNPTTGYAAYLDDQEDLLTPAEETALLEDMIPITEYGGVAFVSAYNLAYSSSSYAQQEYQSYFGSDSGTLFLIDMGQRNIWIHSNGEIYRTVTKSYANTITDNVYSYASDGDYYGCAAEAFRQEATLLEGGRIARPMKHITNALLSMILGVLLNFLYLRWSRSTKKTGDSELFRSVVTGMTVVAAGSALLSRRRSHLASSSGSGGGGFSGGGGGGGGGGSSGGGGGGGGHSF